MVERPIKKSERQSVAEPNQNVEPVSNAEPTATGDLDSSTPSVPKRTVPPVIHRKDRVQEGEQAREGGRDRDKDRDRGRDKGRGRGKGNSKEEDRPPAIAALMRGPKPTQPKPPVVKEPEVETAAEGDVETTTEGESTES